MVSQKPGFKCGVFQVSGCYRWLLGAFPCAACYDFRASLWAMIWYGPLLKMIGDGFFFCLFVFNFGFCFRHG